ncbi:MAG: cytidine deaminase [Clostridiales bacterium]|jgi:cytidine deaminase|nr:cytidine deaminase [Clostridiales bacterium]
MEHERLIDIADGMKDKAYAPYSGYRVGAALLCADGTVVTGCNVENASYGATVCAERAAIVKAVSEGKREFLKIAVSVSGGALGMPCGICRQFISEFADGGFEVICANQQKDYRVYTLSELLPHTFRGVTAQGSEPRGENI